MRVLIPSASADNSLKYNLEISEQPDIGLANPHHVLIKVAASGINRADIYQSQGFYNAPDGVSDILGLEVAGEIIEIGDKVKSFKVGDKVCALLQGGGYADIVSVSEWRVLPKPNNISLEEAASLPEALFTSFYCLMELAKISPSSTILIQGGAGGIGSMMIQLAKHLIGAKVVATAGSSEKAEYCKLLGADNVLRYDLDMKIDKNCFDCIIEIAGGKSINNSLKMLKPHGTLILLGLINGAKTEVSLGQVLLKQLIIKGVSMRQLDEQTIYELKESIRHTVLPLIESGKTVHNLSKIYKASDAEFAHQDMLDFKHIGKMAFIW